METHTFMPKSDFTALIFVSTRERDWMKYSENQMLLAVNEEVKLFLKKKKKKGNN